MPDLPDKCLLRIFSQLPTEDQLKLRLVNQRWNRLLTGCMEREKVFQLRDCTDYGFEDILHKFPSCTTLIVADMQLTFSMSIILCHSLHALERVCFRNVIFEPFALKRFSVKCPQLVDIEIENCQVPDVDELSAAIMWASNGLTRLSITWNGVLDLRGIYTPNLQSLRIHSAMKIQAVIEQCAGGMLQESLLSVDLCRGWDVPVGAYITNGSNIFSLLHDNCPHLQTLCLRSNEQLIPSASIAEISQFTNLTHLCLENNRIFLRGWGKDNALIDALRPLRRLVHLDVCTTTGPAVGVEILDELPDVVPDLQTLCLSVDHIKADNFQHLQQFQHLQKIKFYSSSNVCRLNLYKLAQTIGQTIASSPRLTELEFVSITPSIPSTDQLFKEIVHQQFEQSERLISFDRCPDFTCQCSE